MSSLSIVFNQEAWTKDIGERFEEILTVYIS